MSKSLALHWYFISIAFCPTCGREDVDRERRYGPRPDSWHDRHKVSEVGCSACKFGQ